MGDIKSPLEPIALVGSSCRFSGNATSPSRLWKILADPIDHSQPIPVNRFSRAGFFHKDPEHHGTTNSPFGYWLSQDPAMFDAAFFNITRKEAEAIDPQQRLLLEVVYEALESAGYLMEQFAGREVGVYAGVMTADYKSLSERDELNTSQYAATGNASSIISNRISYFYDFHGPSMTIDTACSASLVALHQAVLALRSGEIEMACVTGVNLMLTPEQFISESDLHMLSPTGHCRMWDADADGYARGEGVVAFFLKTLSQALADGDNIQAVVRQTGVNSDGKTQGITMPNPAAQAALIRSTYEKAGLDCRNPEHQPQYFEAHGTGTPAGDPREAQAISEAFFGNTLHVAEDTTAKFPEPSSKKLLVGSVKTIIGHTEGAAGLAGILKVILAMQNCTVPLNLHHKALNPSVRPFYDRLEIPTRAHVWPSPPAGQPMRASVNSFGFGGTNAHAIVEKYMPHFHNKIASSPRPRLNTSTASSGQLCKLIDDPTLQNELVLPLIVSAASEESFVAVLKDLVHFIDRNSHVTTHELAWHLYSHRTGHSLKASLVSGPGNVGLLKPKLEALIQKASTTSLTKSGDMVRSKKITNGPRILGVFTGQGAQYPAMSRGVLQTSTVYQDVIKKLDLILQTECPDPPDWSLEEKIMAVGGDASGVGVAAIAQPLSTALQIALVELLKSLGITFRCVVGHSSGEIAAAFAANRLSMRDAILIAYYRGHYAHLASGIDGSEGGMMACGLSKEEAEEFCSKPEFCGRVCVAANNSPCLVTLSGDFDVITAACEALGSKGKFSKLLKVDTAYHSFHMAEAVKEYSKALSRCGIQSEPWPHVSGAIIHWVSSVYACQDAITSDHLSNGYWEDNMLRPVLFHEAIEVAVKEFGPFDCAVEVGPHPQLQTPATETINSVVETGLPYHGVLRRGQEAAVAFAEFLGFMCVNFDTSAADLRSLVRASSQPELLQSRLMDAPSYAWDHTQAHWRESRLSTQYHSRQQPPHELLGVRARDDNQFEIRWRNILKAKHMTWVDGHRFQGQALLPASAYCVMALDAAKVVLDGRPASVVELQDLRFLSGITIEPESLGIETLFTLSVVSPRQPVPSQVDSIEAEFTLTSVPVTSSKMGPMKKNFEGRVIIVLGDPSPDALPHRHMGPRAETLPVNVPEFYRMMEGIGLSYTGPFQALTSIERRLDYARALLRRAHPSDTTRLDLSPAFLDSCFQATFATFSSPGDKALWASFLPTKIGRMRFSQALCGDRRPSASMTVESHLASFNPYSSGSPATITADLSISNEVGQTEVQLEDLTVSSFSSPGPEDDYELYLHTVMDVDPECEIITARHKPRGVANLFDESCERVSKFYLQRQATNAPQTDTPPASPTRAGSLKDDGPLSGNSNHMQRASTGTEREIDQFISASPYSYALDLIRHPHMVELSRSHQRDFPCMYRSVVNNAYLLHGFCTHLGRVVQQIAHRFPRMDVLDLTFAECTFTENILGGLGGSFSSYRLMESSQPARLLSRCPALHGNNKVSFEDLDLDAMPDGTHASNGSYDLVVLSATAFSRFSSDKALIVQRVQRLLRKRGFLILAHAPASILEGRTGSDDVPVIPSSSIDVETPFDSGELLQKGEFLPAAKNSIQNCPSGCSIVVRQAGDDSLGLEESGSHESVIIVGEPAAHVGSVRHKLQERINPTSAEIYGRIEDVTQKAASAATVVMLIMDLTRPVCLNMTERALAALKSLMQPGQVILWVTCATEHNPETAASLGLTRTLKAENPDLIMQVLDFHDSNRQSADVIVDRLRLLIQYRDHLSKVDSPREHMLFSFESEIHIDEKRQIVPRVLPYRPAIERLNASRRQVLRTYNSLETCLLISSAQASDGSTRFELSPKVDYGTEVATQSPTRLVNVEYSSLYPVSIGPQRLYVCIGTAADSGQPVAGVSPYLASKVPVFQAVDLSRSLADRRSLALWLVPIVSVSDLANWAPPGDVVLVEPHPAYLRCAREILPPRQGNVGFSVHVLTSDPVLAEQHADNTYVHRLSSRRELKRAIPRTNPTVIDFLPGTNALSKTIRGLSGDFRYSGWPTSSETRHSQKSLTDGSWWTDCLTRCVAMIGHQPPQLQDSEIVTPALLNDTGATKSLFTAVDWVSDRLVPVPVKPLVEPQLLNRDRTYILVGLTRDLGQSLCRLLIRHGARNIIVASRSPNHGAVWISELNSGEGASIRAEQLDVTDLASVEALGRSVSNVGGIVNGAMVLNDRVFAQMDAATWTRVLRPKTTGSRNLDRVFCTSDLEFFIMTSSFAAIGGHAGQSNYAAANMFMNGLAASRRRRGLAGSVLNMGVIYGLGLLARERKDMYQGLEREGYPPVSERDIHHMFLEAIVAGRPGPGQVRDLTTGLARYRPGDPNPLHWHRDSRFSHYTVDEGGHMQTVRQHDGGTHKSLRELIGAEATAAAVSGIVADHFCRRLATLLQLPPNSISAESCVVELGVDSLMAVEMRNWFYKVVGSEVPVMKILRPWSIAELCLDIATKLVGDRE